MDAEEIAKVLAEHWADGAATDCLPEIGWVSARRCECGWHGRSEDHSAHLAAVLAPLVEQAKREGAAEAGCGGCRGRGAHRRLCPRHPGYHPWLRLIAAADSIGDSVGVPELANRAWSLAGAIRVAMLDHPYRAERAAQTPRDGGGS